MEIKYKVVDRITQERLGRAADLEGANILELIARANGYQPVIYEIREKNTSIEELLK